MAERHPTKAEIELFAIGADDEIRFPQIASHLASCHACANLLAREARLELALGEAADAARFCFGCGRVSSSERCDHCGVSHAPGGFIVERVLVQTAHGRLYLARDPDGRQVALKELVFTQIPNSQALIAFEKEAKLLQELEHPGVPRFVASFTEGEGVHTRLYLAQEFVEGASLAARLGTHRFTEEEAMHIARGILDILEYLHGLNPKIIHRDIKPANILQRRDGSIVLVDFGSARDFSMTGGATLVGTFGYIPPEQLVGMSDETSDLYGLGATLAHLLTRRPPWQLGPNRRGVADLGISAALRDFIATSMAEDPAKRYASAKEARRALDLPVAVPRFNRTRMLAIALVSALVTGAFAMTISHHRRYEQPPAVHRTEAARKEPIHVSPVHQAPVVHEPVVHEPVVQDVPEVKEYEESDWEARPRVKRSRVRKADPGPMVLNNNAFKALGSGRLGDAKDMLLECVEKYPNSADCHRSLGSIYANLDDTAQSIVHYKKYLQLRPNARDAARVRTMLRHAEGDLE